jgi:EAL domain-containing protein (putative c-di-GMP-specific phosphodiesterase class I)
MHDIGQTIDTINELKQLGVYISIDDYGTGFSTLSYLKKFPVDVLKIDREFIINLVHDKGDRAIISSTILLAHNLGMSVVAEGVEDDAQLAILRSYGCEEIQGYYFSPPVPAAKFEELIRNGGFVVD